MNRKYNYFGSERGIKVNQIYENYEEYNDYY